MGLKHFSINCIDLKAITKSSKIAFRRLLYIGYTIISLNCLVQCEGKDRYYRPNLPEKLCSIGIIDADDTSRHISFEKSFQSEYPEEIDDSLRNLSFTISSATQELFQFQASYTVKNVLVVNIPNNIKYNSGESFYLSAREKNSSDISAEAIVPAPPPEPKINSFDKEIINLPVPQNCTGLKNIKNAVINISFNSYNIRKQYFAILLEGSGYSYSSSLPPPIKSYLDFSIRDYNSPGFAAIIHGLKMNHWICSNDRVYLNESPVTAYFIDGDKIPQNRCNMTISAKFQDTYSTIDILKSIRIKLLSIPEELYLFEKSLYTFNRIQNDPFTEPIYINGNIKGGNGVFAICRSTEISFIMPFPQVF
jgi:hypothetical protein